MTLIQPEPWVLDGINNERYKGILFIVYVRMHVRTYVHNYVQMYNNYYYCICANMRIIHSHTYVRTHK